MKNILKALIASLSIGLASACMEKSLDVIEISEFSASQEVVTHIIEDRVQLIDIEFDDNLISFKLVDAIIKIDAKLLPFISLDKQGYWLINGKRWSKKSSPVKATDSFPAISLSEDGFLIINGKKTHFKYGKLPSESNSSNAWIIAIVKVGSYICIYSLDSHIIIPIVDSPEHIIPDYFLDHVVEQEMQFEESISNLTEMERYCYIFFTDAHWGRNQKHSPGIIKHIIDYTPVDRVLYGGDAITHHESTIKETLDVGFQFRDAFHFLGHRMLGIFGNHDDNSTGQPQSKERHLSEEQVYSFLQSQMTDVTYWDYYNFYYDDPISKTRFMCLDTGRFYDETFRGSIPKTVKFIIECLSSVPDDWHIVVASHLWLVLKDFNTGEAEEAPYLRPIIEVLEDYNLRLSSMYAYEGNIIPYDFSSAKATIEYCIGGHIHTDAFVLSQRGLPLITVTCDGQQEVAGGLPYETGTINEQSVSIVVNDYQNKEVGVYRIGRGSDMKVKMWNSIGSI